MTTPLEGARLATTAGGARVRRGRAGWYAGLATLVGVRFALPLLAIADRDGSLPGIPSTIYEPLPGDAHAYYWAARELLASAGRLWPLVGLLLVTAVVLTVAALRRTDSPSSTRFMWLAVIAALSGVAVVAVLGMRTTGASSIGWPLAWATGLLPVVVLPGEPSLDVAYGIAVAFGITANAATVVALALAGRRLAGAAVGLAAACLFALWPVLSRVLAGPDAWVNGSWEVDTGLAAYSEPLSTALLVCGFALLLRGGVADSAGAGVLIGAASAVRISNALIALAFVAYVALARRRRNALAFTSGLAVVAPVAVVYAFAGTAGIAEDPRLFPEPAFAFHYARRTWEGLPYATPAMAILPALAALGLYAMRRDTAIGALLAAWALASPLFYTFYFVTWTTPRFLFASLPALVLLCAVGAAALAATLRASAGLAVARRLVSPGRRS